MNLKNYETILLELSDGTGDHLWLDHNPPIRKSNGYYILMIHGMEGDSGSHYVLSMAKEALHRGYGVIRMNMRNCGPGLGYATLPYNAGKTEDLQDVINFIFHNISKNIFVSGFSLSANLVLKFFGEKRKHYAKRFTAVSPPLDLMATCENIDAPKSWMYKTRFLMLLKKKVINRHFPLSSEKIAAVLKGKTFYQFDDQVTAPLSGFRNATHYYNSSSAKHFIPFIQTPGLVVHAKDDPLIPEKIWNQVNWSQYAHIETVLTEYGGHIGFLGKKSEVIPDGRWLQYLLLNYFDKHLT